MPKLSDILGINARSADFLVLNKKRARAKADDKLLTKEMLARRRIPHPKLLGVLSDATEVNNYDWSKLVGGIVVKPVQGLGGEGVMLVRKSTKEEGKFVAVGGKRVTQDDLRLHALDIIEGRYSHNNLPDKAMIEERIKIHPKFRKMAVGGAPDVRVIVFNKVPVMAMLRLPTEESFGKANLHQGAIGLGIDMATGITTYGVYKNQGIKYFPDTDKKVNGILIPDWEKLLLYSVKTQMASKLSYLSVDFLLDEEKGPVVLELNDQPGLSIQLANMAGLKKRLERIEGLEVDTAEKGVRIAKALFASDFSNKVGPIGGEKQVVGVFENIGLRPDHGRRISILAKVDTGARSTSIDESLARELGLLKPEHILWETAYKSALGRESRKVIQVDFKMRGKRLLARASVTKRHGLRFRMIIGRRDLEGFLVNPKLIKSKDDAWKVANKKVSKVTKFKSNRGKIKRR